MIVCYSLFGFFTLIAEFCCRCVFSQPDLSLYQLYSSDTSNVFRVSKRTFWTAALVALTGIQPTFASIMALKRLRGVFRRPTPQPTPEPVLPLTFLRDSAFHVFMHIVEHLGVAGLVALARTDKETYKCLLPLLKREKERVWNLLLSVNEGRPPLSLSFGRVMGYAYARNYCLCRRSCSRKPRSEEALKSVFPWLVRMRHDLRRDDRITLISSDHYFVTYRITSTRKMRRQGCDHFPLEIILVDMDDLLEFHEMV